MGRPRDITKSVNRRFTVVLTEKAMLILREVIRQRKGDTKWFHRYVSEHVVNDFEGGSMAHDIHVLLELEKQRDAIEARMRVVSERVSKKKAEGLKMVLRAKRKEELERIGRPE